MGNSLIYLKSQTAQGNVNFTTLLQSLQASNITKIVENLVDLGDSFVVVLDDTPTTEEQTTIDNIITAHSYLTIEEQVKQLVTEAVNFGNTLIIEFAAENVLMGITQAGKTKDVADYLQNVVRYLQSGSLYEVVNEVDQLIINIIPQDLSPFITEERLNIFKQKVLNYLS